jgi:tetratricopeptide (TPR) repeat protein
MNLRSPLFSGPSRILLAAAALALPPLHAQRMELTDATAAPVVVESAAISTEVTGRLAVTTFDLVFRNPNSRVLEGSLVFPLLDGQSVIRFALDLNGALREAVPVDKTRARVVFEEIERRGIDPGLIEQVAGNNYRARIYPIPANGTRRVVLAYQEDLAASAYRLALEFPGKLKTFRLAVRTLAPTGAPAQARTTLPLELPAWRDGQSLAIERTDFAARGLLELTLPPAARPAVITGRAGDTEYFYAETPVTGSALPRPAPKQIGLLWDSSGSGRTRDHEREFALLDAWFSAVPDVEVRLVRLRDTAEAPKKFAVKNGNWSALKQELTATIYDGATSLDGLADDPSVKEWLLFSDGHINYGVTAPSAALPFRGAVHSILASPGADSAWLRRAALRHGGEFTNLLTTAPAAAAAHLRSASLRVLDVGFDPEAVAQVFPEIGTPVTAGQITVTGILRRREDQVTLLLGHNQSDAQTVTLTLRSGANASSLAARAWASAKIAHLSLDPAANREDIRRTSRTFGIVTADTSLIVLETVSDYVRYDIAPPPELRAEWEAQRQASAVTRQKSDAQHLESVLAMFQAKIAWWKKSFPKDQPSVKVGKNDGRSLGVVERTAESPSTVIRRASPENEAPHARLADVEERSASGTVPPTGAATGDGGVVLSPYSVSTDRDYGYLKTNAKTATRLGFGVATQPLYVTANATPATPVIPPSTATITLQPWSSKAGYLDHLNRAPAEKRYAAYLEERADHGRQPGFFLDIAHWFFAQHDMPTALRILSNLAELEFEDVALLRVLAHRLTQADRPDLALPLFERVLALRPDEPQSHRDLALVCAALGQYQRAVNLLADVVNQTWDPRFPEIELIALTELNALAATCGQPLDLSRVDPRLRENLPVAARVILTWDANDCDIDLWVTDPNGETAIYNHPLTYQGGRMSSDFTGGYGPEEFMLRDPKPGQYAIKINYYGDRRQSALGPVTAQVRLITGFGTAQQTEKRLTVRLQDNKETLEIGTFEVPGKK